MPNSGFRSLFADEVEALHATESLISKTFPSLKKNVSTKELVLTLDQRASQAKSYTWNFSLRFYSSTGKHLGLETFL